VQEHTQEALPLLKQVLREKPDYAEAHYSLGKLMLDQGDVKAAISELEFAVKFGPEKAYAHYQLGRAYLKVGRQDDARQEFQRVSELKALKVENSQP